MFASLMNSVRARHAPVMQVVWTRSLKSHRDQLIVLNPLIRREHLTNVPDMLEGHGVRIHLHSCHLVQQRPLGLPP